MAETTHARSRRAALAGLALQLVATGGAFALAIGLQSSAFGALALYTAGGIPIWFVILLVFRQQELAALEALDLEELRREKQATGGGEALFEQQPGGVGLLVAETRLRWMRRWLIPFFSFLSAAYLIAMGLWRWIAWSRRLPTDWPALQRAEIGFVLNTLLMLFLFFFARYAAGMARVQVWQLLRGGASYMLGNAVATMAVIVALGAYLYRGVVSWEHGVGYGILVLMIVLGVETLINLVLDIYRPRAPGVEARASFDSRLLGLISEPGGIAHSLAEALNYQFGFQVSQTWFYQLLQRALVWLVAVGALAVWVLSCIVVVQPYERAIIERFGRQLNPDRPLEPGLHFKLPAPIELARKYNTDQLHEFYVGYRDFDQPKRSEGPQEPVVELWTDPQHGGRDHFDFVIAPTPLEQPDQEREHARLVSEEAQRERTAQHLARMVAVVQYKIDPARLADFTRNLADPHAALRKIAWNEVVRYAAANHIDALLGEARAAGGPLLRERIARHAAELGLGVELKYVGILQVHPTQQVAEAFRSVVTAQQQRIGEIRKARVTENEILSRVAGDKRRALALVHAIEQVHRNELRRTELERQLRDKELAPDPTLNQRLAELRPLMIARLRARWRLELDEQELTRIRRDFELGLGGSLQEQARAQQAVAAGREALRAAEQKLEQALAPLRAELRERYQPQTADALLDQAEVQTALEFWNEQLEQRVAELEGEAAVTLAKAQARRWELELRAAGEVALLNGERDAYAAAPQIYRARSYLQVLVAGLKEARKYFLAFTGGAGRKVHVRLETQEQPAADILNIPTEIKKR